MFQNDHIIGGEQSFMLNFWMFRMFSSIDMLVFVIKSDNHEIYDPGFI